MDISAPLLTHLLDFAFYRGIPRTELTLLLEDPNQDLCNPENRISEAEYLKVLQKVSSSLKEPELGFLYGNYLNLQSLGLIYTISLSTKSIEQALLLLNHYLESNFPLISLEQRLENDTLFFELESNLKPAESRRLVLESTWCVIMRELSLMISPEQIEPHLPQLYYGQHFPGVHCPIIFSKGYGFKVEPELINGKINEKVMTPIEVLLPKFMEMIQPSHEQYPDFALAVRNMTLNLCSPEIPDLNSVAGQFAMSPRSFQRHLSKTGWSFRGITNAIKKELSAYLKASNKIKTQDIAWILGYSESAAYLHAAKSW